MLASSIKQKLKRGEVSIGSWMSLGHPSIGEILAAAGYDWVLIETEHTAIDNSEVLHILMAIQGKGVPALVRPAGIDPLQTKAILDSGASGMLVPLVKLRRMPNCGKDVQYPPQGFCGVGVGGARLRAIASRLYATCKHLIVQIEHRRSAKH